MNIVVNAYLDNNLGDDLMIKLLSEYFEDDDIYIYLRDSILSEPFLKNSNIHYMSSTKLKDFPEKIDLHVTIGGSLYILNNIKSWIYFTKRIIFARQLQRKKIKSAVIGCNLGPYDKRNIGFLLSKLEMRYKNLITVRDKFSYNLLVNSKLKKNKSIIYRPDIVFSNPTKNITRKNRKFLGISAYRSLNGKYDNRNNYKALAKIADNYIMKKNQKVKIFAFDCETENDLVAAEYIKKYSNNKDMIEVVPYLGNIDEFMDEIDSCEAMLAIRFHSAIISGTLGIPFWAVSYSNKMRDMMEDNRGLAFTSDLANLAQDVEKISDAIYKNKLFEFREFDNIRNSSLEHFHKVRELIENK